MKKDLDELMKNIKFINSKDLVKYEDEDGNLVYLPLPQLILSCEALKVEEDKLEILKFEGKVDKKTEFNKCKKITQVDKSTITNNKKDKGTIVDKEVEAYEVWLVRNSLNVFKSFNNKEEAINYTNLINDKILKAGEFIKENEEIK